MFICSFQNHCPQIHLTERTCTCEYAGILLQNTQCTVHSQYILLYELLKMQQKTLKSQNGFLSFLSRSRLGVQRFLHVHFICKVFGRFFRYFNFSFCRESILTVSASENLCAHTHTQSNWTE